MKKVYGPNIINFGQPEEQALYVTEVEGLKLLDNAPIVVYKEGQYSLAICSNGFYDIMIHSGKTERFVYKLSGDDQEYYVDVEPD